MFIMFITHTHTHSNTYRLRTENAHNYKPNRKATARTELKGLTANDRQQNSKMKPPLPFPLAAAIVFRN